MWIHTVHGFVSVVQHRDDPDTLIVRARSFTDLEDFTYRANVETGEIWEDETADYRFRCHMTRPEFTAAMASAIGDIDYGNYKDAAHDHLSDERVGLLHRVWSVLYGITAIDHPTLVPDYGYPNTWPDTEAEWKWPDEDDDELDWVPVDQRTGDDPRR